MSKKVLIVEDDNILQKAIHAALKAEGYEVIQAFDGEEGFKKIKKEKPDLVILDLLMPVQPGEWVLKQMCEKKIIDDYPVIVLSVKKNKANVNNCINELKANDYLFKGDYSLERIIEKVKKNIK